MLIRNKAWNNSLSSLSIKVSFVIFSRIRLLESEYQKSLRGPTWRTRSKKWTGKWIKFDKPGWRATTTTASYGPHFKDIWDGTQYPKWNRKKYTATARINFHNKACWATQRCVTMPLLQRYLQTPSDLRALLWSSYWLWRVPFTLQWRDVYSL